MARQDFKGFLVKVHNGVGGLGGWLILLFCAALVAAGIFLTISSGGTAAAVVAPAIPSMLHAGLGALFGGISKLALGIACIVIGVLVPTLLYSIKAAHGARIKVIDEKRNQDLQQQSLDNMAHTLRLNMERIITQDQQQDRERAMAPRGKHVGPGFYGAGLTEVGSAVLSSAEGVVKHTQSLGSV